LTNIPNALLEALGIESQDIVNISTLGGGVSADIWRVDLPRQSIVIKRACGVLRVKADWQASPKRYQSEVDWHNLVRSLLPDSVPQIIAVAPEHSTFSMPLLDYPLWKTELLNDNIDLSFAEQVAKQLAQVHAMSAGRADIAVQFAHDDLFTALRVEPYFLTAAGKYAVIQDRLRELGTNLLKTKLALMHGDISPKNILIGNGTPVFLDAETACYGDPAFDMAFCLTHLMLKCLLHPDKCTFLTACIQTMLFSYLSGVDWEDSNHLALRITCLLPAIMLARVDGKSPVEYLDFTQQALVRRFCLSSIQSGNVNPDRLIQDWIRYAQKSQSI